MILYILLPLIILGLFYMIIHIAQKELDKAAGIKRCKHCGYAYDIDQAFPTKCTWCNKSL